MLGALGAATETARVVVAVDDTQWLDPPPLFAGPALQAILPSLDRTPEELIAANAASSTVESFGTLVGPLMAGVLVSVADAGVVFLVGAGVLLIAAVLLQRMVVEGRIHVTAAAKSAGPRELVVGGFRLAAGAPKPRLIVSLTTAQAFVRGCLNVLIVVAAFRLLGAGAGGVGYLTAALGVGGLVGAFGAFTLEGKRLAVPLGIALVFWRVPIALIAPSPHLVAAMLLLAVVGGANSVEDVAVFTLLQRIVPDEFLTRVLGIVWGLAMGAVGVGSITAPGIVAAIGARPAFVVVGANLPLVTVLVWRQLVRIDREVRAHTVELELVDGVPIFAPLSIAAKEHMAARMVEVPVAAGEVVIRAGRPRRPVLRRCRGRARGHERPPFKSRTRRLLRRDRTPAGRAADGPGDGAVAAVRARA